MPSRDNEPGLSPQSPLSTDFARQQKKKQQGNNYHSSSLSDAPVGKMTNPSSVNRTSLHPTGVEYVLAIPALPSSPATADRWPFADHNASILK